MGSRTEGPRNRSFCKFPLWLSENEPKLGLAITKLHGLHLVSPASEPRKSKVPTG